MSRPDSARRPAGPDPRSAQYARDYDNGWRAAKRNNARLSLGVPVDRARPRAVSPAWHDGFYDQAAEHPKWTYRQARLAGWDNVENYLFARFSGQAPAAELHPLLGKMTKAAALARETFEVLDPARTYRPAQRAEPGWPRDLDSAETTRLLELLHQITDAVAGCVEGVAYRQAVPAQLKARLEALCTELAGSTMQLHWLARDSQRAAAPGQATVAGSTTFPSRPQLPPARGDHPRPDAPGTARSHPRQQVPPQARGRGQ